MQRQNLQAFFFNLYLLLVDLCIGGDHSIPIPIGRALSQKIPGKFGYIHFDAHIDCQPNFAGEPCVARSPVPGHAPATFNCTRRIARPKCWA